MYVRLHAMLLLLLSDFGRIWVLSRYACERDVSYARVCRAVFPGQTVTQLANVGTRRAEWHQHTGHTAQNTSLKGEHA